MTGCFSNWRQFRLVATSPPPHGRSLCAVSWKENLELPSEGIRGGGHLGHRDSEDSDGMIAIFHDSPSGRWWYRKILIEAFPLAFSCAFATGSAECERGWKVRRSMALRVVVDGT